MDFVVRFWRAEQGATAIEYGLMAALIVVAIIGALGVLFGKISQTFGRVSNALVSS